MCYNLLEVLKLSTELTQTKLNLLPIITDNSFFAETKNDIDLKYAQSIIGDIIYFNWKHDGLDESISGKVLDILENKLRVYINYVFMLDEDLEDASYTKDNPYITDIPITDISNVFVSNDYIKMSWENIPDDYNGKIYEITNIHDNKIIALAYNCDTYLYIAFKIDSDNIKTYKYPISLIKCMQEL